MLAHIHIRKTGGQTLCDILRQSFPGRHCDMRGTAKVATPSDIRIAQRFYSDLASISGHCVIPRSGLDISCPDIRFFTILRDPLQRCVSHYQFFRRRKTIKDSFEVWLPRAANYQVWSICRTPETTRESHFTAEQAIETIEKHVGFVGILERFDESLVMLKKWINHPDFDIVHRSRNISVDNTVKKQLLADSKIVEQIMELHREDYKLYQYIKNVMYPKQQEAYGPRLEDDVEHFKTSLPGGQKHLVLRTIASAKRNLLYKPYARFCMKREAA